MNRHKSLPRVKEAAGFLVFAWGALLLAGGALF